MGGSSTVPSDEWATLLLAMAVGALLAAAVSLPGCQPARHPEACSDEALTRIEMDYAAAVLSACPTGHVEACPLYPVLRDAYDARRQAWVECR